MRNSRWRGYRPACAAGLGAVPRSPAPALACATFALASLAGLAGAGLAGPGPGDAHLAGGHEENDEMLKDI